MIFFIITFIFADQIKENTPTQENIPTEENILLNDLIKQIIATPDAIDGLLKNMNTLTAIQLKNIKKDSLE